MKKKIFLVTGGTGFIGSNISKLLVDKNYNVRIFDNNSRGNINKIKNMSEYSFSYLSSDNFSKLTIKGKRLLVAYYQSNSVNSKFNMINNNNLSDSNDVVTKWKIISSDLNHSHIHHFANRDFNIIYFSPLSVVVVPLVSSSNAFC